MEPSKSWPPGDVGKLLGNPDVPKRIASLEFRLGKAGFDHASVEDVVQEVLFEVLQAAHAAAVRKERPLHPLVSLGRYPSESSWWGYYFKICLNRLRKQAAEKKRRFQTGTGELGEIASAETGTEEMVDAKAAKLPPSSVEQLELKERAVFVLLQHGFTQAEISRLMKVSPARVSQLKAAAVRNLRAIIRRLRGAR